MWRRDEQGNQFSFFFKKKRGGRKEGKRQRDAYPRKGQGCCLSDKKPFLWCLVGPTPNERHAHSALLLLVCRTRNANLKTLSTDAPVRFAYQPPARQYFSLRTNRAPPTSQRYFFLSEQTSTRRQRNEQAANDTTRVNNRRANILRRNSIFHVLVRQGYYMSMHLHNKNFFLPVCVCDPSKTKIHVSISLKLRVYIYIFFLFFFLLSPKFGEPGSRKG